MKLPACSGLAVLAALVAQSASGANVAAGKPVEISSGTGGSYLTDGEFITNSRWMADYGFPQTAEVNLGSPCTINRVLFSQHTQRTTDYEVHAHIGGDWVMVASGVNNTAMNVEATFSAVVADRVRFVVTTGELYLKVYELEIFGEEGAIPAAPGAVSAEVIGSTSIRIQWTDNSGEALGFRIERSVDGETFALAGLADPGSTSFTDAGLSPETTYSYRVIVTGITADSPPSPVVTAVTLSRFEEWARAHIQNESMRGHADDPDFDGASNILERALGSDPERPDQSLFPHAERDGERLALVFRRSLDAEDLLILPQTATDLGGPWKSGSAHVAEEILSTTEDWEWIKARPARPPGELNAEFMRLSIDIDTDQDGMGNEWEKTHNLDPANAADGALDPDEDGLTNLQEFELGTDPNAHNTTGGSVVTIVAIDPEAYEFEGKPAEFEISRTGAANPISVNFTVTGGVTDADYVLEEESGNPITGSILIGPGAASVKVRVRPVHDSLNEYPERLQISIAGGSGYSADEPRSATIWISDAMDVPANEQIFVGALTPVEGVTSSASGVGILRLNGPKTRAVVSLSFSGLGSSQTNAYIRYGESGAELRPNLGTGQLEDVVWEILPQGTITGQQIISALFQANGSFIYTNVGTVNYPAGEISCIWTWEPPADSYPPPPSPEITPLTGEGLRRDVARFLTQATFGPTEPEIDALVQTIETTYGGDRIAAFEAWIDDQLARDQSSMEAYVRASDKRNWTLLGLDTVGGSSPTYPPNAGTQWVWWLHGVRGHDQLGQRFAFAASEIFVISRTSLNFVILQQGYGTSNYYDMLGSYASGNFRDMLESVSKHPIMAQYLSSLKNQKAVLDAQGNQIVSPDENYAREVMQLFSIGLVKRRLDGAAELENGLPVATYDNHDIQELARVFTGWSFSKTPGPAPSYPPVDNTNFNLSINSSFQRFFNYAWTHPMKNFAQYHDFGAKVVLGVPIPEGLDAEAEFDMAHDILFHHGSTPAFICRRLIQFLVTSNPSPGYLYRVSSKFVDNGHGVRGDMKAVLKAILLDYEARDLGVADGDVFGKQKEPILRFCQILRSLRCTSGIPLSNLSPYGYPASQLDNFHQGATHVCMRDTAKFIVQAPQMAPSVFNWFQPDYAPNGPIASSNMVAPEMQIITETSVTSIINFHRELVRRATFDPGGRMSGISDNSLHNIQLDTSSFVAAYDSRHSGGGSVTQAVEAALDRVDEVLMAGGLRARYKGKPEPNPRSSIIEGVSAMSLSTTAERIRELLYLVVSSPEFVHQR